MSKRVCPWWLGYFLASPLRRLFSDDPRRLLAPYIRPGMTVLEPGPGMGYFTLELARLVGPTGRVIALDVQPRMLAGLRRRARRAGLADRIDARLVEPGSLGLEELPGAADFALAFAMVHEFRDDDRFFRQVAAALRPGGTLLLVEPAGHVQDDRFDRELESAARAGLSVLERPSVRHSRAALLRK